MKLPIVTIILQLPKRTRYSKKGLFYFFEVQGSCNQLVQKIFHSYCSSAVISRIDTHNISYRKLILAELRDWSWIPWRWLWRVGAHTSNFNFISWFKTKQECFFTIFTQNQIIWSVYVSEMTGSNMFGNLGKVYEVGKNLTWVTARYKYFAETSSPKKAKICWNTIVLWSWEHRKPHT